MANLDPVLAPSGVPRVSCARGTSAFSQLPPECRRSPPLPPPTSRGNTRDRLFPGVCRELGQALPQERPLFFLRQSGFRIVSVILDSLCRFVIELVLRSASLYHQHL